MYQPTHNPERIVPRFTAKVKQGSGCWEWQGYLNSHGYGQFRVSPGKLMLAHRFAYELFIDLIPEGMQLDHLCRNRRCVNPSHLEVVDNKTNSLRGVGFAALNATKTHCPKGHPYEGDNLGIRKAKGWRNCRACNRERVLAFKLRQRDAGADRGARAQPQRRSWA